MKRALLFAALAGTLLSQAFLLHGAFALAGVVAFGLALRAAAGSGGRTALRGALVGALTQGLVGLHCWGFVHYGWALFAAVVVYLALSGALVGALGVRGPAAAGLAWCGVELLHALGPVGFPLFLGGSQAHLAWRSALGVVGAAGLSGLLVAWGAALVRSRRAAAWATGALVGVAALGAWQPGLQRGDEPVAVAVVQGAVPNWLYELAGASGAARTLVEEAYARGTDAALSQGADLVFLPETALRRSLVTREERVLSATLPAHPGSQATVVMGTARAPLPPRDQAQTAPHQRERNSAVAFRADRPDRLLGFVDKAIRVPFVEGAYGAGETSRLLALPEVPVGVLICYESMNPLLGARAADAGLLAILTNDAGFEWAPVSVAHARQGWARAVELGRPLVRAAQAGISLLLDERGRPATAPSPLFRAEVLRADLRPVSGWTWYTLLGRWLIWAALPLAVWRWWRSLRSFPRPAT